MFTISNKKGQVLTRDSAQQALDDFKKRYNPTKSQVLTICETTEDPKLPGIVVYTWGSKSAKGRVDFIQSLISDGKL